MIANKLPYILIILLFPILLLGQKTALEISEYTQLTTYDQLTDYIYRLEKTNKRIKVEVIGKSVEGRNIYAMIFSKKGLSVDKKKLKVIVFAQQHGNEQSGKEAILILAREILEPTNSNLLDIMDIVLIPQVNPDGAASNQRRNANGMDLNRNHLIMTEPETQALHRFADRHQFDVTIDVHEYWPYGKAWKEAGYRKNSDVTFGVGTNLNISDELRRKQNELIQNHVLPKLKKRNIIASSYLPGGPPEIDYMRFSTFDINDGRQSFGIQGKFSLIQEGMNGEDLYLDNIFYRARAQKYGLLYTLNLIRDNVDDLRHLIKKNMTYMMKNLTEGVVSIQMRHISDGKPIYFPGYSYNTFQDTMIETSNFKSTIESIHIVKSPYGYLIPKSDEKLTAWIKNFNIDYTEYRNDKQYSIKENTVIMIDSIDFEGDQIINPILKIQELNSVNHSKYWFVPTVQQKGLAIIQALEPKSMMGLATYDRFKYMIQVGKSFPILRVELKD